MFVLGVGESHAASSSSSAEEDSDLMRVVMEHAHPLYVTEISALPGLWCNMYWTGLDFHIFECVGAESYEGEFKCDLCNCIFRDGTVWHCRECEQHDIAFDICSNCMPSQSQV